MKSHLGEMASSEMSHFSRSGARNGRKPTCGNVRNCTPCFSHELLGRLIQAGLAIPWRAFSTDDRRDWKLGSEGAAHGQRFYNFSLSRRGRMDRLRNPLDEVPCSDMVDVRVRDRHLTSQCLEFSATRPLLSSFHILLHPTFADRGLILLRALLVFR